MTDAEVEQAEFYGDAIELARVTGMGVDTCIHIIAHPVEFVMGLRQSDGAMDPIIARNQHTDRAEAYLAGRRMGTFL